MIYTCEDCGFLFYRLGEIMECPFCEEKHIRPASIEESHSLLELLGRGDKNAKKGGDIL